MWQSIGTMGRTASLLSAGVASAFESWTTVIKQAQVRQLPLQALHVGLLERLGDLVDEQFGELFTRTVQGLTNTLGRKRPPEEAAQLVGHVR
jgi:hypothetical protein